MKFQKLLPLLICFACHFASTAQIGFSNQTQLLTPADHRSGVAIAVLDMNGDGLDDIARLNFGTDLNVQYQTAANQAFTHTQMLPLPGTNDTWGMCAADVDNDGYCDVLAGGFYNGVTIATANGDGTFSTVNMASPQTFVQGVNFADINNDSWLDAFVCHDDGVARIFGNNGDGTFTYQPSWIDLKTYPASDNSGNYGSVWSDVDNDNDLDLYIAHCRQGVSDPTDPRRINQLFWNNGDGTYTQDTANVSGLRIGAQSWTADFADIDNDGDFDCFITNHDVSSQLLENDGFGHFTDISVESGIYDQIGGSPIQGVMRDFDNDGFVDILVAGSFHYLFRNNGDKTFSSVEDVFDNKQMESYALGDLNGDGFQDIYAGYANIYTTPSNIPDAMWLNDGNDNHFFGLTLRGVQSNRNGVGAKVTLHSALGTQVREVRSGESYGISNSLQIHFGMGQVTEIDSVIIRWPSGIVDVLIQPIMDQYLTFGEGGCLVPSIVIEAAGNTTFCTGQSVEITAPAGYNYLWNNGDTTQTITATTAGEYKVTVADAEGCTAVSNTITTTLDPIEVPTVTASGDTTFCAGYEVVLTASAASSYLWNTGATTQNIVVTEPGEYTVTTQGLCDLFTSIPKTVTVLEADLPVAVGDTVLVDSTATLTASGELLQWYASAVSAVPLLEGDTFVTPPLAGNTTFWVSNTSVFDIPNQFVGMVDHEGSPVSDNNYNGGLIFDSYAPFRLSKVKVYTTKVGNRKIDLRTVAGQVIQTKTVNILNGTSILQLDFDVPVGTDFLLTTDETVNDSALGTLSPQLRRSNQGCAFPYDLPGVLSIKNSTFNTERYYYFYNWEIDFYGYECESERVPVVAVVAPTSGTAALPGWATALRLFPNPTSGVLTIDITGFAGGDLSIALKNAQGATLQTRHMESPAGKMTFETDFSGFAKGVYWLELASGDGMVRRKVVVQ